LLFSVWKMFEIKTSLMKNALITMVEVN